MGTSKARPQAVGPCLHDDLMNVTTASAARGTARQSNVDAMHGQYARPGDKIAKKRPFLTCRIYK